MIKSQSSSVSMASQPSFDDPKAVSAQLAARAVAVKKDLKDFLRNVKSQGSAKRSETKLVWAALANLRYDVWVAHKEHCSIDKNYIYMVSSMLEMYIDHLLAPAANVVAPIDGRIEHCKLLISLMTVLINAYNQLNPEISAEAAVALKDYCRHFKDHIKELEISRSAESHEHESQKMSIDSLAEPFQNRNHGQSNSISMASAERLSMDAVAAKNALKTPGITKSVIMSSSYRGSEKMNIDLLSARPTYADVLEERMLIPIGGHAASVGFVDPDHVSVIVAQAKATAASLASPHQTAMVRGVMNVSHHLPDDPMPSQPRDVKIKWPKEYYKTEPFAKNQYSLLYDHAGIEYIMTYSKGHGGFGKIADAISTRNPNELLAVKILRHRPSRMSNKNIRTRTRQGDLRSSLEEIDATVRLQGIFDHAMKSLHDLPPSHPQSLKKAYLKPSPFKMYGYAANEAKVSMIMTRDAGDVAKVHAILDAMHLSFFAKTVFAQTLTQLHLLATKAQMAHLDISSNNLLVTDTGRVRLIDFGLKDTIIGQQTRSVGLKGSIATPESVGIGGDNGAAVYLGTYTDVFAVGALTAQIYQDSQTPNIFSYTTIQKNQSDLGERVMQFFQEFAKWRIGLGGSVSGFISASQILAAPPGDFKAFFEPMAFNDPVLCELIINHCMCLNHRERKDLGDLSSFARSLLPENPSEQSELTARIAENLNQAAIHKQIENMVLYHHWAEKQADEQVRRAISSRGKPMNLPG